MVIEQWLPIAGFEGLYEVSDQGRVRSLIRTTSGRVLSGGKRKNNGYVTVVLFKNGKGTGKTVHRLVAEAFIPNIEGKPEVNHIDGNKRNNSASNLQWVTPSENQQHSISIGLRRGSSVNGGGNILVSKQVNDAINRIAKETGKHKCDVANDLLLYALSQCDRKDGGECTKQEKQLSEYTDK